MRLPKNLGVIKNIARKAYLGEVEGLEGSPRNWHSICRSNEETD